MYSRLTNILNAMNKLFIRFQLSMNLQMSQSQSMTLGSGMNPHHQLHNMTSGKCLGLITINVCMNLRIKLEEI